MGTPKISENYRHESDALCYAAALIDTSVWKEDGEELELFNRYEAKDKVKVTELIEKDGKSEQTGVVNEIPGSRFRVALAGMKAFASYSKLDPETQRRINLMYFGQQDRPAKGTDKHKEGTQKIRADLMIVGGGALSRPRLDKEKEGGSPFKPGGRTSSSDQLIKDVYAMLDSMENEAPAGSQRTTTSATGALPDSIRAALDGVDLSQFAGVAQTDAAGGIPQRPTNPADKSKKTIAA